VGACPDLTTDVSDEAALAILEPYFDAAKETFEEGLHKRGFNGNVIRAIRFQIDSGMHDKPRHFAGCEESGRVIRAAPEMVELTEDIVAAVMLHELGHATDFLFPGQFRMRDGKLEVLDTYRSNVESPSGQDNRAVRIVANRYHHWSHRDPDTIEVTADKIVEFVTGRRIGYLGPCTLQHLDQGRDRPRGLR
jgi:hypothetical protein